MTKYEISELLENLEAKHESLGRDLSIYSRAKDEILRSHEFIRLIAWRFSDYSNVNWSGPDVIAHCADFFGQTVKELDYAMERAARGD